MLTPGGGPAPSGPSNPNVSTMTFKGECCFYAEMEEKVNAMMKLIEADADTFGKKAELYFRRRPELINYVEEMYKAYKALADRCDRISGELHKANHTIASAFPDQVEFAMQDDEYDDTYPKALTAIDPSKYLRPDESPDFRSKESRHLQKKPHHKRISSQISKEKAQEEIERLQKEILGLQTEKEYIKSSYESTFSRYMHIEKEISEMQEEVYSLQDAFNASAIIEDDDARALMAATAIKSCEDSLANIQEQQKVSDEETRVESERIKDAKRQLMTLKGECDELEDEQTTENADENQELDSTTTTEDELSVLKGEKLELQTMCEKVKEHFEMSSESSVVELAERIDELVDKVISLEVTVSSQNAQITRLRSETDELQDHLRSVEEAKMALVDNSNILAEKLKQAEDELQRVQHLEKCIYDDKGLLQLQFIEACHNLSSLSEKLLSPDHQQSENNIRSSQEENYVKTTRKSFHTELPLQTDKYMLEGEVLQTQIEETDDIPDLLELLNGLEGKDKALLSKYTSIVQTYRDTKRTLREIEKRNQQYHLETMAQVKELKTANAIKDQEIRVLKEILNSLQASLHLNGPRKNEKQPDVKSSNAAEDTKMPPFEDKFRADIDNLLEENLDFWLRFSTSYHQIQKFQITFKELKADIEKLNEVKNPEGNNAASMANSIVNQQSVPLDKRLRELNTELQVWLEKNALLNGELKCRFSSLCKIQDEISSVSKDNEGEEVNFTPYQAAKFQGEVLSMQLENNKVAKELQAGVDYVRGLQVEISWALAKLNKKYELSAPRTNQQHSLKHLSSKTRVPLRTFLFGAKPKKPSIFSCMNPVMHKQYSHLRTNLPR
ncbi:hypothetical protein Cni_G29136 [Canna indica]|uniref:NAB domain-containing protein n=1 Tax=Canna indica TaxID=4628 RepID=A0AAQ3QPC8_9LILI|nr:hypothetical protein Cni_G29136 [Canna indica]